MTREEPQKIRERDADWDAEFTGADWRAADILRDRRRLLADYDHLVEVARGLADVSEEAWGAADCGYVPNDRVRAAMKDRIAALRALIDPATPEPVEGEPGAAS